MRETEQPGTWHERDTRGWGMSFMRSTPSRASKVEASRRSELGSRFEACPELELGAYSVSEPESRRGKFVE